MAINLTSYIDNPFTDKASFNRSKFKKHVRMAQRIMDDLVELEIEAVKAIIKKVKKDPEDTATKSNELNLWEEILKKCINGRRTGLGITGLGDFISMLNIKYGSDESISLVDDVYSILRNEAYKSSIEMAKERGSFPIFDPKKERGNKYLSKLPPNIRAEMNKVGRRNIGCLTTAPVGSGSTVSAIMDLFGTSSGFEPVFKCEYKRKRKLTENDTDKPDFIDEMGDKWKEYIITHSGLQKFKDITGKGFKDSSYCGAEAGDLDFIKRVEMQAKATQYVDHAISSTINLPIDIDIETVSKLYITAWECGCKGLTIYRSGSRDGVLTGIDSSRHCEDCDEASKELVKLIEEGLRPTKIIPAAAPKRPEVLECDIHRSRVGGGDWLFFVGKLNGRPYELFGGDSAEFTIPHKYRNGWIRKNGKDDEGVTQYNLILGSLEDENEKLEFKGIAKHFNNYEYGAFTRLTSLTMRHGAPIKYICEQITKKGVEGDLFSFQRAMARVLKKYIAEGEKSEAECPMCRSTDVIYKNGCPTCQICGHSNCA
jgi:ribonucleoside-diphosphate reductase alpha chain